MSSPNATQPNFAQIPLPPGLTLAQFQALQGTVGAYGFYNIQSKFLHLFSQSRDRHGGCSWNCDMGLVRKSYSHTRISKLIMIKSFNDSRRTRTFSTERQEIVEGTCSLGVSNLHAFMIEPTIYAGQVHCSALFRNPCYGSWLILYCLAKSPLSSGCVSKPSRCCPCHRLGGHHILLSSPCDLAPQQNRYCSNFNVVSIYGLLLGTVSEHFKDAATDMLQKIAVGSQLRASQGPATPFGSNCLLHGVPNWDPLSFASSVVFDSVILFLTVIKLREDEIKGSMVGKQILRDNVLYFVIVSVTNIVVLVINCLGPRFDSAKLVTLPYPTLMTTAMGTR